MVGYKAEDTRTSKQY